MKKYLLILIIAVFCGAYLSLLPMIKNKTDWTVICYFNGDNNLSFDMLRLLDRDIEPIGSSDSIHIYVLFDGNSKMTLFPGWDKTKLLYLKKSDKIGEINAGSIIKNPPTWYSEEMDMGKSETMKNFIGYALKKRPSKKTMFIFFSHGEGTAPEGNYSFSPDAASNSGLTLNEFSKALEGGLELGGRKKFDMILMFSCVTNMAGFNYSIKGISDRVIASEDVIYFARNYKKGDIAFKVGKAIEIIKEDPDILPDALGRRIIDFSVKSYGEPDIEAINQQTEFRGYSYHSINLTAVNLNKMELFLEYFNNFTGIIHKKLKNSNTKLKTVKLLKDGVIKSRRYWGISYHDLVDLLNNIREETDDPLIAQAAADLALFTKESLISYHNHRYVNEDKSHGISIFIPFYLLDPEIYKKKMDNFKKTEFSKATLWDEIIEIYMENVRLVD